MDEIAKKFGIQLINLKLKNKHHGKTST
jgi:hypothetical protein